ncbi:unnamed protein product [Blepharisma stoltei]|uniref:C2H2-type domain-containing protein n=1 Tax=Blepharisma stoltei TaxID=1481888 RepID=A0AAU9J1V9_9CILI|nr:unnamed protein product [Blepharisma stoltei]
MKTFKCFYESCSRIYSTKFNLGRHINVFHKNNRFPCSICGERLSSAQNLKDHSYCHTGQKPYACKHSGCTKRYRQASQLSVHKKKHRNNNTSTANFFTELNAKILLNLDKIIVFDIPDGPYKKNDAKLPPIL